jgi:predicted aspartyl protease
MKVPYTFMSEGVAPWMPMLTVRLRGPEGLFELPMLVDSGACETMLPEALLGRLGVELSEETTTLVSFSGQVVIGRVGQIEIQVGDVRYTSRIAAIPDALPSLPILGHRDFFMNFWVGFDSMNRALYVSPARKR